MNYIQQSLTATNSIARCLYLAGCWSLDGTVHAVEPGCHGKTKAYNQPTVIRTAMVQILDGLKFESGAPLMNSPRIACQCEVSVIPSRTGTAYFGVSRADYKYIMAWVLQPMRLRFCPSLC
jgi:hypothetical protein